MRLCTKVQSTDSGSKSSSMVMSRLLHIRVLSGLNEIIQVKHLNLCKSLDLCVPRLLQMETQGDEEGLPPRAVGRMAASVHMDILARWLSTASALSHGRFSVILSWAYAGRGSRLSPGEGRRELRPTGAKGKRKVPRMGGGPGRGGLVPPGLWGSKKGAAIGAFPF